MESLESKLDRLSPEQRREIEDYVDFLLQRPGPPAAAASAPAAPAPPLAIAPPPPLPAQEPFPEPASVKLYDLIRRQEPAQGSPQEDPAPLLKREIAAGGDDPLTGDYMDYGQFEQPPPSPATEAVKRIKEKISRKKEHDPAIKILEWID